MSNKDELFETLAKELNDITEKNIEKYNSDKFYTSGPRHDYLLGILSDSFTEFFEKYYNDGSSIFNFLGNKKVKRNLIILIGKNNSYDLNYLNSIYDDLLNGVGISYNFQNSQFKQIDERKHHPIKTFLLIVLICSLIILLGLYCYYVLPVLVVLGVIIGVFMGKHGL